MKRIVAKVANAAATVKRTIMMTSLFEDLHDPSGFPHKPLLPARSNFIVSDFQLTCFYFF